MIRSGCSKDINGETWVNWWLYPRLDAGQVEDVCDSLSLGASGNGPGTTFTRAPVVRHSLRWTLIKEFGGWDV